MKAFGVRGGLVGDCVAALPVYRWLRKREPSIFTYWQVSRKCAQAAPLFYNNPLVNELVVSDCNEGMGPRDQSLARQCQWAFNVMPQHPDGDDWPNRRGVYHETFRMAGLSDLDYATLTEEERWPYLTQWFETTRFDKGIAIWPGSRQGEKENRRNPPWEWWKALCIRFGAEGYKVYQCGHVNDLKDYPPLGYDMRTLSLVEAIKLSLGCDLAIGTDSGSMIALAAYHSTPTLSILSPHWTQHTVGVNPLAFGPLGKRHTNLWAPSNLDHDIEKVVDTVRQLV